MRHPVLDNTVIACPPLAPELRLHLATPETRLWRASEAEARERGVPDPYWAFCWAGGQMLARYILDHPAAFSGRRVLDFGAGGGVAAIAAALVGATASACDLDPIAASAIELNAHLNGVRVDTLLQDILDREEVDCDVLLVGDVTYEPDLSRRVVGWLRRLAARGVEALIGDPGRGYLDERELECLARYAAPADNDVGGRFMVDGAVYRVRAR